MKAIASPPLAAPATCPASMVVWITAVPRAYWSPGRMAGVMEARADSNGGANMVAANSRVTRVHRGTCGAAMMATRPAAGHVAADHHGAAGAPVGDAGQEQATDHPGQVAGRVGHGGQQRGSGPVIDQQGQGDQGEAVAGDRQDLGEPQAAEFPDGEDVAEPGRRSGSWGVRGGLAACGGWPVITWVPGAGLPGRAHVRDGPAWW
jgi:hypothetical protein